ncbi:hypothetical protein ACODT3_03275 [Streptomyces sp. 4.24]|uniref:hypothetical protein n=1 Tax=Streptomyces tritrimontium TaxID=3406573 RepID=UPI003BB521E0
MLIELIEIGHRLPGRPLLALVRTPFGEITAAWRGDPAAEPGDYHVEWTIDEELDWGRNAEPARPPGPERGPEVRAGEHGVVSLRGWLDVEEDGGLTFRLGGSLVLLEAAGPLPAGVVPGWVRVWFERERVELFPYGV